MSSYLVSVTSTISAAGILAGVGYLRAISRRLGLLERKLFRDELHLLDHEERISAFDPRPRRAQR